jgi:hypothetical protein
LSDLPAQLLATLSPAAAVAARVWWGRLRESDRDEIIALCIPDGEPTGAPRVIGGRFVPSDDAAGWSEWMAAYFEDLIDRPDPALHEPPFFRTFHIG